MSVLHFLLLIGAGATVFAANIKLPEKVYYNLDKSAIIFKKYIKEFNKKYDSNEYQLRLEIFKDNLRKINEDNANTNLTVFGLTQFSDLTPEEFASTYLMGVLPGSDFNAVEHIPVGNAPAELDYRQSGYVTDVKSQGGCGSCYAFSAIGNIEGQYAKQHNELISLSEQQGIDCDSMSKGCDGGHPNTVMQALASQGGSMREEDYPYEDQQGSCHTDSNRIAVKVTGGSVVTVNDEEGLKDLLANTGPLSIAIVSCGEFKQYNGGIYHYNCPGTAANHAVLLVGYGSENGQGYWIVKNSWNTNWGEQGYIRMLMGVNLCNIVGYISTSTVA